MRQPILDLYETTEFRQWGYNVVDDGLTDAEMPFLDLFENIQGRVLDIGCGGGRISLALRRLGFSRITGIDFSAKLGAAYVRRFASAPQRLPAVNGTAVTLPFRSESFDYIACLGNLLSFIADRADRIAALIEIERVLSPGGIAVVSVLHFPCRKLNFALYPLFRMIRIGQKQPPRGRNLPWLKKGGRVNFGIFGPREPQAYWFTEKELIEEIGHTGLKTVKWENTIGSGIPLVGALRKRGVP